LKRQSKGLQTISQFKKDFSISALVAGLIVVLVGMTSSAVVVFQAATQFGATANEASSWLGSLCLGMGILTIYFSFKYKAPILMAWSTPGAVLLVSGAQGFSLGEAIGAFVFSAFLVFIFGITGWFKKIMSRISLAMNSALLAGVLLHFCLDAFSSFKTAPWLVGGMFLAYLLGKRWNPRMTMLLVLLAGLIIATAMGDFHFQDVHLGWTFFRFTTPVFSVSSLISLGIPLFIVTMASQNMTGLSVMRNYQFNNPVSPLITGMGLMNIATSFFGGFTINLAAITAAIAMGPEAHVDKDKRYIAAVISGVCYFIIGLFAASVTSLFGAFPTAMIAAVAGFALLSTVASGLEAALTRPNDKEAAFITFAIAASGLSFFGISSAFWAVVVGGLAQFIFSFKFTAKA
jgi:benzoate membrane transport protein